MKSTWETLKARIQGIFSPRKEAGIEPDLVKEMARGIMTTRPDEIGCAECFEQLDQFVEINLAGKDPAEAMPLVQDHLNRCSDCREEYEALLEALRSMS